MRKLINEKRKTIKNALASLHSSFRPRVNANTDWTTRPTNYRKVTLEHERTFIFRSHGERQVAWCAGCAAEVEMASLEAAAHQAGVSELAIYQLIESGALHFAEDANGRVLICFNSLRQ